jgi:prolyl-tRNA synthetase
MLPLGLRVQDKIEKLIDKHMQSLGAFKLSPAKERYRAVMLTSLGASKLALSSLSAQSLWEKSGRLTNGVSEVSTRNYDRSIRD